MTSPPTQQPAVRASEPDPLLTWRRLAWVFTRVYLILLLIFWLGQEVLLFPGVLRGEAEPIRELQRIEVEHAGGRATAWRYPSTHDRALLTFHGNAELCRARLSDYGEWLDRLGFGWVCMEYRGFDDVAGWPRQRTVVADGRALLHALPEHGLDVERVIVHGRSMGGGVAAQVAHDQPVAGLVLESTYDSVANVASRKPPVMFFPVRWLLRSPFDSATALRGTALPVFQAHDIHDEVVPFRNGEALARAIGGGQFHVSAGQPHGAPLVFMQPARPAFVAWLEAQVPAR